MFNQSRIQSGGITIPNGADTGSELKSVLQQIGGRILNAGVLIELFMKISDFISTIVNTTFTTYSPATGIYVVANGPGVTAVWATGVLTVTIPSGVIVRSLRVAMANGTNIQAGADAGGLVNWIRIKIDGTQYNADLAAMHVPIVQKVIYNSGIPSLTNGYAVDIDNAPVVNVVAAASNSITIRISGISAANGSQFILTEI